MRMVVTDLAPDSAGDEGKAHQIVNYRHIEGKNYKTVPEGPVSIKYLFPLEIRADGRHRLALMADLGPSDGDVTEFVLLALFDVGGKPKLLDVVEVGRPHRACRQAAYAAWSRYRFNPRRQRSFQFG